MSSAQLAEFVKQKEGYREHAYADGKQYSFGYGSKSPSKHSTISRTSANARLNNELNDLRDKINTEYADYEFNANETDALVSFTYNLGFGSLKQLTDESTRSKEVIGQKMLLYVNAGGSPSQGLIDRRQQEANLYNTSDINSETNRTYSSLGVHPTYDNPIYAGPITKDSSADFTLNKLRQEVANNRRDGISTTDEVYVSPSRELVDPSEENEDRPGVEFDSNLHQIVDNVTDRISPNRFKSFSTMTYNISLYLLTPGQYANMVTSGSKDTKDYTLLIQSGGKDTINLLEQGKLSKHFENDYYINNFQLGTLISGTASGSLHNAFEIKFTITEPAGITFIDNLNAAVREMNNKHGNKFTNKKDIPMNYVSQMYLAVIRFYGYDAEGNILSGADIEAPDNDMFGDQQAAGEKFIPFRFTNIAFKLDADKVVYTCQAIPPHDSAKSIQSLATTRAAGNITGKTLGTMMTSFQDLLNAKAQKQANSPTNITQVADTYEIRFEQDHRSSFVDKAVDTGATKYLKSSSMNLKKGMGNLGDKITAAPGENTYNLSAGTSITRAIDVIIQTSEFVTEQQAYVKDKNDPRHRDAQENPSSFDWYKVTVHASPTSQYDIVRGDYAYNIIYTIRKYKIDPDAAAVKPDIREFPEIIVHKEYNHWFTGENTEILEFNQQYDALWYQSITDNGTVNYINKIINDRVAFGDYAVQTRYVDAINNAGNNANSPQKAADIAANITSTLYSPADQAMLEMKVVGDPDYIAQQEIFYSAIRDHKDKNEPVMQDGSVNYDYSEIHLRINFNTVVDYNEESGLAYVKREDGKPKHSFIYRVTRITNMFSDGKFEQKLEGVLKPISFNVINNETGEIMKIEDIHSESKLNSKTVNTSDSRAPGADFSNDSVTSGSTFAIDKTQRSELAEHIDASVELAKDETELDNKIAIGLSTALTEVQNMNYGKDPNEIVEDTILRVTESAKNPYTVTDNTVGRLSSVMFNSLDEAKNVINDNVSNIFSTMNGIFDKNDNDGDV